MVEITRLKVILDVNFFFIPSKFKVNIFEELSRLLNQKFETIILSSTMQELQGLVKSSSPKIQNQASLALRMTKKCHLVAIERSYNESYDDVIVRAASEWKAAVGTNDTELRKRLRKKGIPVIFLRQKGQLTVEGAV